MLRQDRLGGVLLLAVPLVERRSAVIRVRTTASFPRFLGDDCESTSIVVPVRPDDHVIVRP